jgi:hypothetical protein
MKKKKGQKNIEIHHLRLLEKITFNPVWHTPFAISDSRQEESVPRRRTDCRKLEVLEECEKERKRVSRVGGVCLLRLVDSGKTASS